MSMDLLKTEWGYISTEADPEGNYHLFYSGEDSTFTQIKLQIDSKVAKQFKDPLEFLGLMSKVMGEESFNKAILDSHPLKIEYTPATPLQSQGLRVQTATSDTWISLDKSTSSEEDTTSLSNFNKLWSPLEKLIQCHQYEGYSSDQRVLRDVEVPLTPASAPQLTEVKYDHIVNDVCYGNESAKQYPMLSKYIETVDSHIQSLEAHLKQIQPNSEAYKLTQFQLDFLREKKQVAINFFRDNPSDMVDSNYFRDLLKAATKEIANGRSKKDLSQDDFDRIYNLACERFIPCLTNCWQQRVQGQYPDDLTPQTGPDHSWMRLGAMYDTRFGLFSLLEFTDETTGKLLDEPEFSQKGKEVVQRLLEYKASFNEGKPHHLGCLSAIRWMLNQIAPDEVDRPIAAPAKSSKHATTIPSPEPEPELNIDGLKRVLMERKSIQETHMLALLEQQLSRIQPGDEALKWLHISLLKPFEEWKSEDKKKDPGWTHNEMYEIKEMEWAFKHFQGAEIVFSKDVTSPRIEYDEAGKPTKITFNIALAPKDYEEATSSPIRLESHFVSCSVAAGLSAAGHKYKEPDRSAFKTEEEYEAAYRKYEIGAGSQQKSNRAFFEYAQAEGDIHKDEDMNDTDVLARLKAGLSSFEAAEAISSRMLDKGWAISGCCQSGKDRTGFWCSRLAQREVLRIFDRSNHAAPDPSIRRCLNETPLRGDRVTRQILQANTGMTAIKVGVRDLPGDDAGKLIRLGHYATLAYEQGIQSKIRKIFRVKSVKVEMAAQQALRT